jgi:hypothetical protein
MPEILLTTKEARQRAKFGASKWRELLSANPPPFPVLRFNSRFWRIREADLDRWIRAGCPMPEQAAVTQRALSFREQRANGAPTTAKRTVKRKAG